MGGTVSINYDILKMRFFQILVVQMILVVRFYFYRKSRENKRKKSMLKNVIFAKFLLTDQKFLTCKKGKMIFCFKFQERGCRQAPDQINILLHILISSLDIVAPLPASTFRKKMAKNYNFSNVMISAKWSREILDFMNT